MPLFHFYNEHRKYIGSAIYDDPDTVEQMVIRYIVMTLKIIAFYVVPVLVGVWFVVSHYAP